MKIVNSISRDRLIKGWLIPGVFLTILANSCQAPATEPEAINNEQRNAELALKEKELELRERELAIQEEQLKRANSIITEESVPELYKRLRSSVYMVITGNDTSQMQGTAFTIDPNGLALSNYHVFEYASQAVAINDRGEHFMIAEVLEQDAERDYILFRISPGNQFDHLSIADHSPEIGEVCFAIGNPKGLAHTLSSGLITGYRNSNEVIQTNAEITHGSSGGPLFNSKGEVIGITTSGLNEANLNFALNIQLIDGARNVDPRQSQATARAEVQVGARSIISNYYRAIEAENYSLLSSLCAAVFQRHYDRYNVTREQVLELARSYRRKFGIRSMTHEVDWNNYSETRLHSGNVEAQYLVKYSVVREDQSKSSQFLLRMIVEISPEGKVESIYENILEQR